MSVLDFDTVTLLPQGTKEYLIVDIEDDSDEITTLVGTSPRFDVIDPNGVYKYTAQTAVLDPDPLLPMRVLCLVDTTMPTLWPTGDYKLFVKFDTLPEVPRVGPFLFIVID